MNLYIKLSTFFLGFIILVLASQGCSKQKVLEECQSKFAEDYCSNCVNDLFHLLKEKSTTSDLWNSYLNKYEFKYYINPEKSDDIYKRGTSPISLIQNKIYLWSQVTPVSIRFTEINEAANADIIFHFVNKKSEPEEIRIDDKCVPAETRQIVDNGRLVNHISFNINYVDDWNDDLFSKIALHEIGQALGLGDVCDDNAIMSCFISNSDHPGNITQNDIDGLKASFRGVLFEEFTDNRDGNVYMYKKIGSQYWMIENLKYASLYSTCYEFNQENCEKYGRLYAFDAARNACPQGWHLPSDSEFKTLERHLGMTENDIEKYGEGRGVDIVCKLFQSDRCQKDDNGTPSGGTTTNCYPYCGNTGFNLQMGGQYLGISTNDTWYGLSFSCLFWTSTQATIVSGCSPSIDAYYQRTFVYVPDDWGIGRFERCVGIAFDSTLNDFIYDGVSCRCVKD